MVNVIINHRSERVKRVLNMHVGEHSFSKGKLLDTKMYHNSLYIDIAITVYSCAFVVLLCFMIQ